MAKQQTEDGEEFDVYEGEPDYEGHQHAEDETQEDFDA